MVTNIMCPFLIQSHFLYILYLTMALECFFQQSSTLMSKSISRNGHQLLIVLFKYFRLKRKWLRELFFTHAFLISKLSFTWFLIPHIFPY